MQEGNPCQASMWAWQIGHILLEIAHWKPRKRCQKRMEIFFSLSTLSPHFSEGTRGEVNAENSQSKLEKHYLLVSKLGKKMHNGN